MYEKYNIAVTPVLTDTIKDFCYSISDIEPFFVDVQISPTAKLLDCFNNVETYIKEHGGEMITGWAIWEQPKLFVEAEFHAIWHKDGQYLDITPKDNPTTRILFVPDLKTKYQGSFIPNVRKIFSHHGELEEFFKLVDEHFNLFNKNTLPDTNQISITPETMEKLTNLAMRQFELKSIISSYHAIVDPYLPCPCGCGKKTKWCDFKK